MAKKLQNKKQSGLMPLSGRNNILNIKTKRSVLTKNLRTLRVGDICELKITALAPNNIGIDEFSYPYAVFVPNAKYGSVIKAKVLKVAAGKGVPARGGGTAYIVAQMIQELKSPASSSKASLSKSVTSPQALGDKAQSDGGADVLKNIPVTAGEVLTVKINDMILGSKNTVSPGKSPLSKPLGGGEVERNPFARAGIVELSPNYRLIIPLWPLPGGHIFQRDTHEVKVSVTRVKAEYAFAKLEGSSYKREKDKVSNETAVSALMEGGAARPSWNAKGAFIEQGSQSGLSLFGSSSLSKEPTKLVYGCKFTTTLPQNCQKSFGGKYVILKVSSPSFTFPSLPQAKLGVRAEKEGRSVNSILFVKLQKGVNLGDKVRIKVTSSSNNCAVGKILQVNPVSQNQKAALVLNSLRDMMLHGMHFGEKAVKCHARMKNYLWLKKQGSLEGTTLNVQSREFTKQSFFPSLNKSLSSSGNPAFRYSMGYGVAKHPAEGLRLSAGIHASKAGMFLAASLRAGGQQAKREGSTSAKTFNVSKNQRAIPLIKKGRHVINLLKTRRCLNKALNTLTKYALKGRTFLFIGTKKPAAGLLSRASFFTKNSFYVNTRWLGGMLTNWKTICKSISKIRPILKEKQKVVRDILERRQNIKSRLMKKALLLRKKSKLILTKGRALLNAFKNNNKYMTLRAQKLTALRQEYIKKGMNILQKRQTLIQKRRELIYQTLLLKEKGFQISSKYKAVLTQLAAYTKKLREYKYLLILTTEIKKLKDTAGILSGAGNNLYSVSYGKLKEVNNTQGSKAAWIIPNPPKEILNRIVLTMKQKYENDSLIPAKAADSVGVPNEGPSAGVFIGRESKREASLRAGSKQILVCSTLLSKFSRFNSYIKSVIKTLMASIKSLETLALIYGGPEGQLNKIKNTLKNYLELKNKIVSELQLLKTKLTNERQVIRIVKRKLKALDAQKKFIKFLPRLRYLPTPQTKISQIVQILLSKVVDPKLKYPIENIYDQKLSILTRSEGSKKLAAARKKKWQRLEKYFGGIANMTKLTKTNISRNIAIIIGQKEEMNAVRECQKLGIKTFTIVDTNCNPTLSDHIIPANDDSRNAIKYILTKFITRIRLAQKLRSRLQKLQKN
uniref:Small ribosomal subunit protein uS2c n=1 Tax=Chlorogonium capillatum TaxID=71743 RepID=A0A0S2ICR1_9CHLO|nr:ribosomal protein S2 [Chlorogonium capillatum]